MNKRIDTSTRVFMAIVGASGSAKNELILKVLMGNNFYLNSESFYTVTKRCKLHSQIRCLLANYCENN